MSIHPREVEFDSDADDFDPLEAEGTVEQLNLDREESIEADTYYNDTHNYD